MSITRICGLLEQQLLALSPQIATAFENIDFTPPATIYQRAEHLINVPRDLALTADVTEWRGIFQVTVSAPLGAGRGEAQTRAQAIADHFAPPQSLTYTGLRVDILKTPAVGSGYKGQAAWCVPVSIGWSAFKT